MRFNINYSKIYEQLQLTKGIQVRNIKKKIINRSNENA